MTDEANLETLYNFIESSKKLGIELPEDILQQTTGMEEKLIREDVLPALRDNIEPVLRQIKRELILVVEYRPNEPISVRISRKRNLSDLSEATILTADPVPGITRRAPQQRVGNRKPNSYLRVTMGDGTVYCDKKDATNTFCDVLQRIGLMRVRQLNIMPSGINLISTSKDENRQQRLVDNFYIFTNRSTRQKADQLREIGHRLNMRMTVEVFEKEK